MDSRRGHDMLDVYERVYRNKTGLCKWNLRTLLLPDANVGNSAPTTPLQTGKLGTQQHSVTGGSPKANSTDASKIKEIFMRTDSVVRNHKGF